LGLVALAEAKGLTFQLSKEKVKSRPNILNDMYGERLSNRHDVIYKGEIQVGTPPKKFSVVFDTGSGLFWLPTTRCESSGPHADACKDPSRQYDPKASSTSKSMYRSFKMAYGTGSAVGRLYTDTLTLGDGQLVMKDVPVGAAERIWYIDHGIIGLSLPDYKNPKPVFSQAVDQGLMDKPIFTTFLRKCNGECENGGSITLGGFDNVNCQSDVHWTPVATGTSMWRFYVTNLKVGNLQQSIREYAITDSGTSYIQFPTRLFTAVVRELKAEKQSDYLLVPCDSKFQMEFTINGKVFKVTEKEVLLNQGFGKKCVLAIGDAGQFNMFLLGDAFLRGHCVVFDIKNKKVGFVGVKTVENQPEETKRSEPVEPAAEKPDGMFS